MDVVGSDVQRTSLAIRLQPFSRRAEQVRERLRCVRRPSSASPERQLPKMALAGREATLLGQGFLHHEGEIVFQGHLLPVERLCCKKLKEDKISRKGF
ncbi:hypothetical protein Krac_6244 [Ktedonobacter racemifer DSM 44963]|uniref:Uncharacterized protein n=1 Tax=Ktedonobacter racemifer DSM 44963 TaxID=485913 RepID=D6TYL4_KTERA|nr:hypothetical protein Krac_6244 [Ktedonobacter racemifer DSM 44963]